jgi:hypothetical protein
MTFPLASSATSRIGASLPSGNGSASANVPPGPIRAVRPEWRSVTRTAPRIVTRPNSIRQNRPPCPRASTSSSW